MFKCQNITCHKPQSSPGEKAVRVPVQVRPKFYRRHGMPDSQGSEIVEELTMCKYCADLFYETKDKMNQGGSSGYRAEQTDKDLQTRTRQLASITDVEKPGQGLKSRRIKSEASLSRHPRQLETR